MREEDIADSFGWSETKTQSVIESLNSSGQVELYETGRGNVVMKRDRPSLRTSDRDQGPGTRRSQTRSDNRDSERKKL